MSFKVPQLKELCRLLGQASSGTKLVLQERLKAYSQDIASWKLMQPGARRSHKGSQSCGNPSGSSTADEKKPKRKTAYAKRRDDLFGAAEVSGPVQRSKDMRTPQEKQDVVNWAAEMVKEFADFQTPRELENCQPLFPTPASREKKIEEKLDALLALYTAGGPTQQIPYSADSFHVSTALTPFSKGANSVVVSGLHHRPSAAYLPLSDMVPQAPYLIQPPANPVQRMEPSMRPPLTQCATSLALPPLSSLTTSPPPAPDLNPSLAKAGSLKVIVLANGTHVEFLPSDVPDPVLISFANDIPQLVRMWDDADPAYNEDECVLKIKGHGIPLRLWDEAYKYGGDQRWKGTKNKWSKWKFVVEAYKCLGEEAFWKKFHDTKTDGRMSFTAIVDQLRVDRKADDARCAAEALRCNGFTDQFAYRGKTLVKPSAIAKRSRALQ